jgi:hypothetical protein
MINQHLIIISIIIISSFILAFTRQTLRRLANLFFFFAFGRLSRSNLPDPAMMRQLYRLPYSQHELGLSEALLLLAK